MRKSNRSKFLAMLLSLVLTVQLLPAAAFAAEDMSEPLIKESGYQNFPAYYNDSAHADNQVTHPDVVVLDEEWNGYRYWAVYTPNVMHISIYENPSIVASNDGVNWVEPEGLSNPIEPQPPSTRYHNCDADMLYNAEMDAMMAYWNWADDQAGGVGAEVRLRISYDGVHWGIPVTYDEDTRVWTKPSNEAERQVDDGPNSFITAIASRARYDMLSPTFVYDDFRDVFIMWANDTGDVGYNNGQRNRVQMRYSDDGITWGDPVYVNNFLGQNTSGQQLAPWHQDVQYIPELKEFVCISQCFSGGNPDGSVLHLTKSKDGINWQQVGNKAILSPGPDGSWDDFQIYRSSFYYEPGSTAGNGTMRVWYSALQKNTTNQMVPDSSGNLTIQAKSGDSRIWRIGYAQNGYVDMMRSLLNDPGYTVPTLVPGTALSLTSTLADGTLPEGETVALQVGFIPGDTSDQIVKFTSSDPTVATINEHGIVTGVSVGKAVITGETREGLTANINISVISNPYTLIPHSSMTATATSVYGGSSEGPASNVLDDNLNTIWHTNYNPKDELPQSLTVMFSQPTTVGKYVYTPRQVGTNGMVTQYELYAVQADGTKSLIASGNWAQNASDKTIVFEPVAAAGLELKVIAGAGGFGTAAEINVYAYGADEPTPEETTVIVDDRDSSLVYTGTWHNDSNPAFHAGTARYTNEEGAAVELTFVGNTIRWYGQKDTNFGTADVYLDGILIAEVNANGAMTANVLLFEQIGLDNSLHTIRIVRKSGVIDVDCLVYTAETNPPVPPVPVESNAIWGNGVKVSYDADAQMLTLYRVEGAKEIQMSKPATLGFPIIKGVAVTDFLVTSCNVERDVQTTLGTGERMTIVSKSTSTGLTRTYTLETSDTETGAIYTSTIYQAGAAAITVDWFVENEFELCNAQDRIWSYNGGGEGPMHYYDTIQKIDLTDTGTFTRENKQDSTAASIPVADIYTEEGGITIGDASRTRREVHTPVKETSNSAQVSIKWPGKNMTIGEAVSAGESFVNIHPGDYYNGLRGYSNAMEYLGMIMPSAEDIPESSYDLRWESWGWGFNWTIDLIIGKLDELQAAGIRQITLDDGWYTNAGDWILNPAKFPNGVADALRLTNAIHDHGMTALLWWRPCDGGVNSILYQQHPEYYVMNADGSTARLPNAGGGYNSSLGYALCPTSAGAIASQVDFINRAMNEWGFDGFKGDYLWSIPKCYNPAHNHAYPEESTENQAEIYRETREAMLLNDPDAFNLLCNCGTPQDYYSLQYMTQIATADPTSLDQTRRRVKAYKALMGDFFPVTTDHNSIWYPSAVGTGSVLIEKRDLAGSAAAEYEKWLGIADSVQLQKGRFIGDLYCYGFDPYETYVVDKEGIMYYAFYRDGSKYSPTGNPDIELKGLDPEKMYRIVDYVNDRVVTTNMMGGEAIFSCRFSNYLLVKAIEISEPDPEPVDPDYGFISVDDRDGSLVYTGTWHDDNNSQFSAGTARYTNDEGAAVEFTFVGTAIRWYGQKDTNFGEAAIYLDGELMTTVNANGSAEVNVCLFESLNLRADTHTLKIVHQSGVIDVDRFAYEPAIVEPTYVKINATSSNITYVGDWEEYNNDEFYMGSAMRASAENAYAEFTFTGTAVRLYAEMSFNFGTADVYLDGELVENVILYGQAATGQLLFERTDLENGEHTIRFARNAYNINLDYIAFLSDAN